MLLAITASVPSALILAPSIAALVSFASRFTPILPAIPAVLATPPATPTERMLLSDLASAVKPLTLYSPLVTVVLVSASSWLTAIPAPIAASLAPAATTATVVILPLLSAAACTVAALFLSLLILVLTSSVSVSFLIIAAEPAPLKATLPVVMEVPTEIVVSVDSSTALTLILPSSVVVISALLIAALLVCFFSPALPVILPISL